MKRSERRAFAELLGLVGGGIVQLSYDPRSRRWAVSLASPRVTGSSTVLAEGCTLRLAIEAAVEAVVRGDVGVPA